MPHRGPDRFFHRYLIHTLPALLASHHNHHENRWNACVPEQKELIKRTALELLSGGARDHGEQAFVKNSIAKLVFEIAKREWPQNWTNLTDLLIEIGSKKVCCMGDK